MYMKENTIAIIGIQKTRNDRFLSRNGRENSCFEKEYSIAISVMTKHKRTTERICRQLQAPTLNFLYRQGFIAGSSSSSLFSSFLICFAIFNPPSLSRSFCQQGMSLHCVQQSLSLSPDTGCPLSPRRVTSLHFASHFFGSLQALSWKFWTLSLKLWARKLFLMSNWSPHEPVNQLNCGEFWMAMSGSNFCCWPHSEKVVVPCSVSFVTRQ
mmetsp:Transcript_130552/g.226911  ORF Transcript_130552/g.226911 Transcript_130552/m.226911 type:complete len:211 (+) Transcript_130552:390-1022(+)